MCRESHDIKRGPENAVAMENLAGVEPQAVSLLSTPRNAAVSIDIGLKSPCMALHIS